MISIYIVKVLICKIYLKLERDKNVAKIFQLLQHQPPYFKSVMGKISMRNIIS